MSVADTSLFTVYSLIRHFLLAFVVGFATASYSENLDWLYDFEVAVSSQADTERVAALRHGLETVLTRITGLRNLPRSPQLEVAFRNLDAYQLQFRYEEANTHDADEDAIHLFINYDVDAVHDLIREANLPIWSAQRPHVLFLISVVEGTHRVVLSRNVQHELQPVVTAAASRRGVAFNEPLMDFDDTTLLREGTIAFGFLTDVDPLKRRFRADVVVTARIDPITFSRLRVWLSIYDETGIHVEVFDVPHLSAAAADVVHHTADYLAQRYAVVGVRTAALRLVVSGISSIAAYKGLLDYLEQWEFIDHVLVSSVQQDRFEFELRTASTWDQFSIHLNEDQLLLPIITNDESLTQIPAFRWHGAQ